MILATTKSTKLHITTLCRGNVPMDSPHKCESNLYAMKSQIHKNNTIVSGMGTVAIWGIYRKLIRKLFLAKCHSFLDTSTKLIWDTKIIMCLGLKGMFFLKLSLNIVVNFMEWKLVNWGVNPCEEIFVVFIFRICYPPKPCLGTVRRNKVADILLAEC